MSTVAVIGMGKIGLPLAAQYLSAGRNVIGVDVRRDLVDDLNQGQTHDDEPGVSALISQGHADGRFRATLDHAAAASEASVVVIIVPLMLDPSNQADYRAIDAATEAVGRGLRASTLVMYETTLPVGDTRRRFGPALERASGLPMGEHGFSLAFSPERVYSGRVLADLARYPKLVGGVDAASGRRAVEFYSSVLTADVWQLSSSETAEFAKLAETTYRDVNIALANEFARYAERVGVDVLEVIHGANSQPFSHIHQPGLGVGGHCIPVYPHFLIDRSPDMQMPRLARAINDGQAERVVHKIEDRLGSLDGREVLVLGLTYRDGVKELAHSQALPLISALSSRGARVQAFDPLLSSGEVGSFGAEPYSWGKPSSASVVITQTADSLWNELDPTLFMSLELVVDGRNSLRAVRWPRGVSFMGIGRSAHAT